ncbi:MAG: cation-transporting P-type ATPase, partial [Alphaproteobacteria bacterium]
MPLNEEPTAVRLASVGPEPGAKWHARTAGQVLMSLDASEAGLSDGEAAARYGRFGPNRLEPVKRHGPVYRLAMQFNNVLLYVLLGSAVVTALLGHWIDTSVILGVVVINAVIGFIQEGKAEKALEAVQAMLSPKAIVRRGGRSILVPAEALVPGDIVLLQSGDRVPADLRLLEINSLQVQESVLTGESEAVEKRVEPVETDSALGDRRCMTYAGTMVTYGKGVGVVVETAERTEIGQVSAMLSNVEGLSTPLLRQIGVFSRWLTIAILAGAAATFAFGLYVQEYAAADMFMVAVSFAIGAIPEGLPTVMTITLAIGVTRMSRRNAIIRRLPAVETLGSVTVICSDKTGTLTHNELMTQTLVTSRRIYAVTGSGYTPVGEFRIDGKRADPARNPDLLEAARAAILCNDSEVADPEHASHSYGNPTDRALMTVGMKADLDPAIEHRSLPRTDLIPFESVHKFMATLHHDHEGNGYIFVKGAPERILDMCAFQYEDGREVPLDAAYWLAQIETLASRAQRVLAVACRSGEGLGARLRFNDVESGFALIALFGLADPPRIEAIEAVASCRHAGIRVKMITGDHATTAQAIARQFGLGDGSVLTGRDLDALDDVAFAEAAVKTDVFARTTPEHKLKLVRALQANGETVAMTGDGVNDAPALKQADIGIAMGLKGTEAAREASEMVLADDNFASIMHAVEEGRTVYDNLSKSILCILPTSGGEALTILAAILFGQALPITPVQILWVNMITAVTLGLTLAFEAAEAGIMDRPPRPRGAPILSRFLAWRIVFVSILLAAATFGIFIWERGLAADLETARTAAVNMLVAGEIVYLLNSRLIYAPSWNREGILGSRPVLIGIGLVIGLQMLFTYVPFMQIL